MDCPVLCQFKSTPPPPTAAASSSVLNVVVDISTAAVTLVLALVLFVVSITPVIYISTDIILEVGMAQSQSRDISKARPLPYPCQWPPYPPPPLSQSSLLNPNPLTVMVEQPLQIGSALSFADTSIASYTVWLNMSPALASSLASVEFAVVIIPA